MPMAQLSRFTEAPPTAIYAIALGAFSTASVNITAVEQSYRYVSIKCASLNTHSDTLVLVTSRK